MEYGLGHSFYADADGSRTQAGDAASVQEGDVLILVLMEYGLGHIYRWAS